MLLHMRKQRHRFELIFALNDYVKHEKVVDRIANDADHA